MSTQQNNPTTYENITCPFCSLHCDDLSIINTKDKLTVKKNGCKKATPLFEQTTENSTPTVKGKSVSIEDAISHAVKLLRKARQPLISGLGTDVSGMRAILALADHTGAIIDHMHGDGATRNNKVIQDYGWMMTTLAEIKNRADLIILVGTDGKKNYPRFFERVVWNKESLFKSNLKQREVVYIGDKLNKNADKPPAGQRSISIECKHDQIGEIIATLHALIVGNQIRHESIGGVKLNILEKLAARMSKVSYGVLVWAPGELNHPHAELTIQTICGLIKYLNRTTRFAGFSLSGNDGGITASTVSTWQCGYPLRVSFADGYPEYDPYKYSTRNVLKRKEADTLVWISSFNSEIKPPRARIPSIIISSSTEKLNFRPDVFIPVGVPGIDHKGQLFRTDNVVALPLRKIRDRNYFSVSQIINRISDSL